MAKYDEQFKKQLVQEYLAGADSYKCVAGKHSVDQAALRLWVSRYRQHGASGLRKKHSHYSAQFKLSVLRQMWHQALSYRQVVALFDLRGGSGVVSGWERRYHEGGLDALEPKSRERPRKMKPTQSPLTTDEQGPDKRTLEELRKENEYLRAEVAYLKKLDALVRAKKPVVPTKRKQ